jgi:hypothetical protein
MWSKFSALRGTAFAIVAGALVAAGSAAAQRGGGGYSSMPSQAPTNNLQSRTYNTGSRVIEPISEVKDPATTLASANVQDSSGQTVGQVRSISTTPDGKAGTVNVSLTTSNGIAKLVAIGVSSLRYDSDSKTLKASLTQSEINSLPAMQSP